MSTREVVVVGGGVIGAACAYYLSGTGWRVTVLDRADFGSGCSHGNCGFVCPSHVLPLAGPGAVGAALRALFKPDSAFTIRPRFDPSLWSWLTRFALRCNARDAMQSAKAIQALLNSSRHLYDQLLATEGIDCEWQAKGLLFVFQTPEGLAHHAATLRQIEGPFGVTARPIPAAELTMLEPALKPGLAGGYLYESDAHLRPDRLLSGWRAVLEARGVTVRERCEATAFVHGAGRAQAVRTPHGEIQADAFVVAAGAWTPLLERDLGCRVPIQPGKGYSITMPRPARCPSYPMMFEEHRVAVTPMQSGYRLGSTMEFAGYDTTLNPRRLALLREGATHYLHEPACEPVQEEWYGLRPMTPDGVPVVSQSPALANVWLAAGHNMLGLSMAPATGKLVAELLNGATPHVDPEPYRAGRF